VIDGGFRRAALVITPTTALWLRNPHDGVGARSAVARDPKFRFLLKILYYSISERSGHSEPFSKKL